jgi:hypothetical protein
VGSRPVIPTLSDMGGDGDKVLPGDVNAGDIVTLPGDEADVLVRAVRLGLGGFQLTVGPPGSDGPGAERTVTLTAFQVLIRHR